MKKVDRTEEDVHDFVKKAAKHYGWEVIADTDHLVTLCQGLLTNYRRYGFYSCPCRHSWGDSRLDTDIACPCEYSHEDIGEYGQCYCGLFLSRDFAASGASPTMIPERRPAEKYPY